MARILALIAQQRVGSSRPHESAVVEGRAVATGLFLAATFAILLGIAVAKLAG